jgi:CMP/dCMP kinase
VIVAIDGPSGAGKSTVAPAVAAVLGFTYLDSGAMYRCVALASLEDPERLPAELASTLTIELPRSETTGGDRVLLDGRDVSGEIRTAEVSQRASIIAADPAVRAALVARQRELLAAGDWVAEGRDIGTVVAPSAEVKVFLTASPRERARRRARERDEPTETVLLEQEARDKRDTERADSPLEPAGDAHVLDSTDLDFDAVVARIVALAKR